MADNGISARGVSPKDSSIFSSPSRLSILAFGLLAALLGLVGLAYPETTLRLLSFEAVERGAREAGDYTLVFVIASSMAAVNMGAYYVLAGGFNLRPFFLWTVPFRILTFFVFTAAVLVGLAPVGFFGVAAWELAGAVATGLALFYENRRGSRSAPQS